MHGGSTITEGRNPSSIPKICKQSTPIPPPFPLPLSHDMDYYQVTTGALSGKAGSAPGPPFRSGVITCNMRSRRKDRGELPCHLLRLETRHTIAGILDRLLFEAFAKRNTPPK